MMMMMMMKPCDCNYRDLPEKFDPLCSALQGNYCVRCPWIVCHVMAP